MILDHLNYSQYFCQLFNSVVTLYISYESFGTTKSKSKNVRIYIIIYNDNKFFVFLMLTLFFETDTFHHINYNSN